MGEGGRERKRGGERGEGGDREADQEAEKQGEREERKEKVEQSEKHDNLSLSLNLEIGKSGKSISRSAQIKSPLKLRSVNLCGLISNGQEEGEGERQGEGEREANEKAGERESGRRVNGRQHLRAALSRNTSENLAVDPSQATEKLTITYGKACASYENVPADKAHAIMQFAGNLSSRGWDGLSPSLPLLPSSPSKPH